MFQTFLNVIPTDGLHSSSLEAAMPMERRNINRSDEAANCSNVIQAHWA